MRTNGSVRYIRFPVLKPQAKFKDVATRHVLIALNCLCSWSDGYRASFDHSPSPVLARSRASRLSRLPNLAPSHLVNNIEKSESLCEHNQTNMEHQRCYIYEPPQQEERAPKRQRTGKFDPQVQLPERLTTYRDLWARQEERIQVRRVPTYFPQKN